MPTSLLDADLKFANLGKKQDLKSRVDGMESYLYQLLEQLRYSFGNLDRTNFNDAGFAEITGIINQPIIAEIKGIDGQLTQITATSAALTTRVEDAEGNITALYQFADEITQQVEDAEGNIATLTIQANSLSTRVTSAEGSITTLTQSVDSIALSATNGSTSSTIRLYKDGVSISSAQVRFTGVVTFSDLENSGNTVINGDNITTGTIRAVDYVAVGESGDNDYSVFAIEDGYNNRIGYIGYQYIRADDDYGDKLWIRTERFGSSKPCIKLEAAGRVSLESTDVSDGLIYMRSANVITLSADHFVQIEVNGTEWSFEEDGLYKNGAKVL